MSDWNLQDAKNRFSAVVREAMAGYPQRVARRGKPAVVVVDAAEYDRLRRLEKATAPSLAEMLLDIPRDGGGEPGSRGRETRGGEPGSRSREPGRLDAAPRPADV